MVVSEMKSSTSKAKAIKQNIEDYLKNEAPYEIINSRACFNSLGGGFLRLDTMGGADGYVVLEFAENKRDAKNNRFWDCDSYNVNFSNREDIIKQARSILLE